MSLDDEAVRHTLLWIVEEMMLDDVLDEGPRAPCSKCKHDRRDHVVNGDADNPTPWPCNFPHSRGAPAILCYCGDYEPMREDE